MLDKIRKDFSRLEGGLLRKLMNLSIWILLLYRISNWFFYKKMLIISKLFWMLNRLIFTVDIDPGAQLAGGVKLVHPMCIVIGRDVISEGFLTVYQSVTLGGNDNKEAEFKGKKIRQPYLMKNVIIYSASMILGPVIVGDNTIIAAGSMLTKNAANNSLVMGINKIKMNVE